jgi:hypothetical protein
VIVFERKSAAIASFERTEYLLPDEIMGRLIWVLAEQRDNVSQFDTYRVNEQQSTRDLLVCTHGTVDAACAKFGYPLYNDLRRHYADEHLRVWRVSHFGGHVFAPTMMDMPTGHYWAYVEAEQTRQIVHQEGDVRALRGHYRGWAGLTGGFLQAAERELWQRHGWEWFGWRKSGEVLAQDSDKDHPTWAEVTITFTMPNDEVKTARARVEVQHHVETIPTTGYAETYNYPQYVVTELEAHL